jgi:DNA invertase Pin-like site-specific DNA recombinase
MKYGYARVSTKEQNLESQIDALKFAGCQEIFKEKVSGRKANRQEFSKLINSLLPGDTLIVYSIDRLGRTSKELINLLSDFKEKSINLKSLTEGVFDTTSPMGEAIFQIMAILKGMEVNVLRERTMSGIEAARARGRFGGRKKGSYNKLNAAAVATMYKKGDSISSILKEVKISRSTLYEYLKKENVEYKGFKKSTNKR